MFSPVADGAEAGHGVVTSRGDLLGLADLAGVSDATVQCQQFKALPGILLAARAETDHSAEPTSCAREPRRRRRPTKGLWALR